jgi:HEAT repeat protein
MELSLSVLERRAEQLRVLKIGVKEDRLAAIRELEIFSFVSHVRAALEDVLLSDPDPELRKQVATSFGKTANPKVVAALKTARAMDPDKGVRQAAYRAIINIEGY